MKLKKGNYSEVASYAIFIHVTAGSFAVLWNDTLQHPLQGFRIVGSANRLGLSLSHFHFVLVSGWKSLLSKFQYFISRRNFGASRWLKLLKQTQRYNALAIASYPGRSR